MPKLPILIPLLGVGLLWMGITPVTLRIVPSWRSWGLPRVAENARLEYLVLAGVPFPSRQLVQ